jgi:hypothetical protein
VTLTRKIDDESSELFIERDFTGPKALVERLGLLPDDTKATVTKAVDNYLSALELILSQSKKDPGFSESLEGAILSFSNAVFASVVCATGPPYTKSPDSDVRRRSSFGLFSKQAKASADIAALFSIANEKYNEHPEQMIFEYREEE